MTKIMIASACDCGSSPSLGTPWGLSEITFSFILARQYPPGRARTREDIRPRSCLRFFQKEAARERVSSHTGCSLPLLVLLPFSLRPQHGRLSSQLSLVSSSFQHVMMLGQRERKAVGRRACFHLLGARRGSTG